MPFCVDCEEPFDTKPGRGRPRKRCLRCSPSQAMRLPVRTARRPEPKPRPVRPEPRRRRTTCASCGRPGQFPVERTLCRDCTPSKKLRTCVTCGNSFIYSHPGQKACGSECARPLIAAAGIGRSRPTTIRPCADCGVAVPTRATTIVLCAEHRRERRKAHFRRKSAVRRGAIAVGASMTIEQLGERDGWRCHLCTRRVDRALRYPHPRSPSFDHLLPVSRGGTDAPTNLALAHLHCNVSRGNRGTVQLLLVG